MRTLTSLLLLLSAVALADPPKGSADDVKKETGEAVDATKRYANEKKEEFQARIDAKLKALSADVTRLKDEAKAKAKDNYDATAKDLDAKQKKADAKAAELSKAGSKAWASLKGGVESAVDDLEKGVENAKAR